MTTTRVPHPSRHLFIVNLRDIILLSSVKNACPHPSARAGDTSGFAHRPPKGGAAGTSWITNRFTVAVDRTASPPSPLAIDPRGTLASTTEMRRPPAWRATANSGFHRHGMKRAKWAWRRPSGSPVDVPSSAARVRPHRAGLEQSNALVCRDFGDRNEHLFASADKPCPRSRERLPPPRRAPDRCSPHGHGAAFCGAPAGRSRRLLIFWTTEWDE